MLAIIIASTLAAASDSASASTASVDKEPVRHCRTVVAGSSRSGDITVCRTKAEWRKRDLCREPTRYCSPAQKAAMFGTRSAFALSEDSRIVCRVVRATGSRLASQSVCLPQREWQRMWDQGRETTGSLQNHQSKQVPNQ